MMNINNLSKIIGGVTVAYSGYQIGVIGKHIIQSKHKTKALKNNLVPLIHASLGLSLGSVGIGLADLSLASSGALHLLSQQVANSFFNYQNAERQKEVSDTVKKLQKNVFIGSCCITGVLNETQHTDKEKIKIFKGLSQKRLNAYINSLDNDTDKESKTEKAKGIFNKLEYTAQDSSDKAISTEKLTEEEKNIYNKIKTDFPDSTFNTHISSEQLSHIKGESWTTIYTPSAQAIPVTGDIIDIIKLNKDIEFENVPLGKGKITKQYGTYLDEDDKITVNNNNSDGQGNKILKKGDKIYKDSIIQTEDDCTYIIQIAPDEATAETNHFLYKNHALEEIQKQQNHFQWDLSTVLASASLLALIGTVALGTPMLRHEMNLDTLSSLGKTIKWGAAFAGALMPCGVNAANMRAHIAHNLEKQKNITIKTPELLDKLADMKIGEDNSDYHFLVDFNGTLTQGSEFIALKSSDDSLSDDKIQEIIKPIVEMGDAINSTHHIHHALNGKLKETDKTDKKLDSSKIAILAGGTYYRDNQQQYAIGNQSLIEEFLETVSNEKKLELIDKFTKLKQQQSKNAVTYIIHNDDIYALKTNHKLREDAKTFLKKHQGKFTVLTGAKLTDDTKHQLELNEDNCREEQKPEDKKQYAENLTIKGKKMPKEKIVAFGDGGNDWGMFHTVNVATQLTDLHDDKHKNNMNLANIFSDVIIPELSDFDILNENAKKQKTPQKILNGLGLGAMALGASMTLSHTHHHNPFIHVLHHLLSIGGFYALANIWSHRLVHNKP